MTQAQALTREEEEAARAAGALRLVARLARSFSVSGALRVVLDSITRPKARGAAPNDRRAPYSQDEASFIPKAPLRLSGHRAGGAGGGGPPGRFTAARAQRVRFSGVCAMRLRGAGGSQFVRMADRLPCGRPTSFWTLSLTSETARVPDLSRCAASGRPPSR